jgi:hypothetical protein
MEKRFYHIHAEGKNIEMSGYSLEKKNHFIKYINVNSR